MVKKPIFLLEANKRDITKQLQENLLNISFNDNAGVKSDSISLKVSGDFKRPKNGDELKLYLGYNNEPLFFCGVFSVQTSTRANSSLSITATAINFSNKLKDKISKTYELSTIKDICSTIAKKHGLNMKSDCVYPFKSIYQTNESDLNFLNRLADSYNCIFSIKNNTLIFLKKNENNKVSSALPVFVIDAKKLISLSVKHSDKLYYKSCVCRWHDTKLNLDKEITVGNGAPCFAFTGAIENESDAKIKAQAKLSKINQGIITGSLSMPGEQILAGANIELKNTVNNEDDGIYAIKTAKHTLTPTGGWIVNIEFIK